MENNARPIQFQAYLPEVFQANEDDVANYSSLFSPFLKPFELLFEDLQTEIEGLAEENRGGIPDLFNPETTPPSSFTSLPQSKPSFDYLNYLASWIALPLRTDLVPYQNEDEAAYAERTLTWNREFFKTAIALYPQRGTLDGLKQLLQAWLKDEVQQVPALILTDLSRTHNDADTLFQLAPPTITKGENGEQYAQIGVNTVLGEGTPFVFMVELVTEPTRFELREPAGIKAFQRAAQFILDAEKPMHTAYQLRIHGHTMQLPEPGQTSIDGNPGAQLGETTLLWDQPWIINSDS